MIIVMTITRFPRIKGQRIISHPPCIHKLTCVLYPVLIFVVYFNRRLVWRFKRWRPAWKASCHARARWSTWSVLWSRRRPPIRKPSSACGTTYPRKPWLTWRWRISSPAPTEKLKRPLKSLELPLRHDPLTDISHGGWLERVASYASSINVSKHLLLPRFPKCFTPDCLIQSFHGCWKMRMN